MSWEQACEKLKAMRFPDDRIGEIVAAKKAREGYGEYHTVEGQRHQLKTYLVGSEIQGFPVEAKYNFCPSCNKVMTKSMAMFNNKESLCYNKIFVRKGVAGTDLGQDLSALGI